MNENTKICCIFNYASHYRFPIYSMMGKELKCHFYFGESLKINIKKFNCINLVGFQNELKNTYIWKHVYYIHGTIKLLSRYSFFLIEGEPYGLSTWIFLLLAKIRGKKTYVWTHGWYGRESKKRKLFKKLFFSLPTGVLLYGDYARKLMINEGLNPNKLFVINNSLDYEVQLKVRKELIANSVYRDYFKNNLPVVVFIGRLNRTKKIDMLFDVLLLLLSHKKDGFNLVLIGSGDDEFFLKKKAIDMSLEDKVWFYGPSYKEKEIGNLIYNADLCVSPGEVGLTAMHSLVYGTPVITHSNFAYQGPEFEAIKQGITGDFFEDGNKFDLLNKIENWFLQYSSDRLKVRDNCYKIIDDEYNPRFQINVLKEVLEVK